MMALTRIPSEQGLANLLYDRPSRPRLSRRTVYAVAAALAVHAGIGVYVYEQRFDPQATTTMSDGAPVTAELWQPQKPQPTRTPPPQAVPLRDPLAQPPVEAETLAAPPQPALPEPPAAAPTVLAETATPPGPVAVTQPPAPQPPPAQRVIRNADWLTKPTAAQMDRLYPAQAATLGITGGATLLCDVAASGAVSGCTVIDEFPKGRGFGAAALAGSKLFKMNPKTVDGKPIEGAKVRIPIVFNLAD